MFFNDEFLTKHDINNSDVRIKFCDVSLFQNMKG